MAIRVCVRLILLDWESTSLVRNVALKIEGEGVAYFSRCPRDGEYIVDSKENESNHLLGERME